MSEKILTTQEAAAYLGLAIDTIYKKARVGELPAARIGRSWRFPKDLIDQWIRERAKERSGAWKYEKKGEDDVAFGAYHLGEIKGELTRKEIYGDRG